MTIQIDQPPQHDADRGDARLWRAGYADPDAFGDVCERHLGAIHGYVLRRVHDAAVAEDLTAETLAQAWRRRERLRPDTDADVAAWLHGIARNLVRRYLRDQVVETRARRRLGMQLSFGGEDAYAALDDSLAAAAIEPDVQRALRRLPASQRRAVALRVVHELSYSDIGGALGCSEPVARMKVARGLRALRGHLEHLGARP